MSSTSNNSSNENNVSSNTPSKTSGQYHSVKGTLVEAIGDLTGLASWRQSGKEEHAAGEAESEAARATEYAEGGLNRISGKKDALVGAVTGDKVKEAEGNARQDKGLKQQEASGMS